MKNFGGKRGCGKAYLTKYRRHTDPNGRNDQNEMKRCKELNYLKQNCPIFWFAIQNLPQGLSGKKICGHKTQNMPFKFITVD